MENLLNIDNIIASGHFTKPGNFTAITFGGKQVRVPESAMNALGVMRGPDGSLAVKMTKDAKGEEVLTPVNFTKERYYLTSDPENTSRNDKDGKSYERLEAKIVTSLNDYKDLMIERGCFTAEVKSGIDARIKALGTSEKSIAALESTSVLG